MTTTSKAEYMAEAQPRDLHEYLTTFVKQAITSYLAQEKIDFDIAQLPIDLRFSAQSSFGDYSMPVMAWASKNKLGRPPLKIAEALATILRDTHTDAIQEVTVTKPGFINFKLNRSQVGKTIIEQILEEGPDFVLNNV